MGVWETRKQNTAIRNVREHETGNTAAQISLN